MAFLNDITLDTNKLYSRILTGRNSGGWSDVAANLDSPRTFTISHETAKNGRVNSVVYFDVADFIACDTTCGSTPTTSTARVQLKLSYNPKEGYTALDTDIDAIKALLSEFINDSGRWAKFKNKEA